MDRNCRIALVAAAFALSAAAAARAEVTPQEFFAAVASREPARLTAMMSPALAGEVDKPVLEAWMQAINERLGAVTAITTTDSPAPTMDGGATSTTARVRFERGTATSTLYVSDGRLQAFSVNSPDLGDDWFSGPTSTGLYERQGEDLIRSVLTNDADGACERMHRSIAETIGRDGLSEMVAHIARQWGPPESVTFAQSRLDLSPESQRLILTYNVACRRASGTCEVQIQFLGMKGHLMGFDFR
jgi:hypothetical protein